MTQAVAQAVGVPYRKIDPLKLDAHAHHADAVAPVRAAARGAPPRAAERGADRRGSEPLRSRAVREPARPHRRRDRAGPLLALGHPSSHRRGLRVPPADLRGAHPARAGRGRAGRREPRAVREPLRHRGARGILRAGHRRGGVPAPLRVRAARQRHPPRAAARGVDHPHADRRRPPPDPPHPQGGPRRDREPLQDHEPARHRAEAAAGRAHPHARAERREMELRVSTIPTTFGDKIVVRVLDPSVLVARSLRARVPARRARRARALARCGRTASSWSPARPGAARPPPSTRRCRRSPRPR